MAWAGCRFKQRLVTLTVLAATGTAVWGTVNGRGPYQSLSLNESLLVLAGLHEHAGTDWHCCSTA